MNLRGDDISIYCSTNLGRRGQQLALTLRVHVGVSHVSLIGIRRYFDGIVHYYKEVVVAHEAKVERNYNSPGDCTPSSVPKPSLGPGVRDIRDIRVWALIDVSVDSS